MSIRARCPYCNKISIYPDEWRGRQLRCGACRRDLAPQCIVDQSHRTSADLVQKTAASATWARPVEEPNTRPSEPRDLHGVSRAEAPFALPVAALYAKPVPTRPCPRCAVPIATDDVFCTHCGTDLATGRRITAAKAWNRDAECEMLRGGWLRFVSILIPHNVIPLPYATEVPVRRCPTALLFIVCLTFLCFPLVLFDWAWTHLMLWGGDPATPQPQPANYPPDAPAWDPPVGQFAWHQLLTAQFLHADFMHLASNVAVLLVFGPKVNELLGHIGFTLSYMGLGALAALAHLVQVSGGPATPGLGASGALMVVVGMYLIFCPQHMIRVVYWLRVIVFTPLFCWPFRVRGIWLVIGFVLLDLVPLMAGAGGGIGHGVHLAGLFAGTVAAALLVAARRVQCGGYDLLAWCFGQEEIEVDPESHKPADERWAAVSSHPLFLIGVVLAAVLSFAGGWLIR